MKKIIKKKSVRLGILICFPLIVIGYFVMPKIYSLRYAVQSNYEPIPPASISSQKISPEIAKEENIVVTHLATPTPLKAIYMSSWAAGDLSFRNKLIDLIDKTEINSIVIDVKDSTGKISFPVKASLTLKSFLSFLKAMRL